ncbi:MAG TPA: CHAD domain-containing protein [Thermomicrobiales bacterium]|nr:CHAD domain-containing protein [Thermomicrobiales bacterium]
MTVESYRSAMRSLIGERWEDVWNAVPRAVEGADIEGVHDVRVASRRLRAAMDVAAPAFPASWYKPLHDAAKEITAELGAVRDRDVMIEYLTGARDAAPPNERPGIDRLIDRVERERVVARKVMETYLQTLAEERLRDETRRRFPNPQPAAKAR